MTHAIAGKFDHHKMYEIKANRITYYVSPSPDSSNVKHYKDLLLKKGIKIVVRLCEKKYDDDFLKHHGIVVIDMPIPDGKCPTPDYVKKWTKIITDKKKNNESIAIHCLSGLGRSPLMICIGLIKIDKIEPSESILQMRQIIKKSLNTNQINFLLSLNKVDSRCSIM